MDITTIKAIGEFGAVGIALFAVWTNYKMATNHDKHFTDAIGKNTNALIENSRAFQKLSDVIEDLKDRIK